MGVDLLRQQQRWRDALMDIRQMMATLVQEVCYMHTYHNVYLHAIYGLENLATIMILHGLASQINY